MFSEGTIQNYLRAATEAAREGRELQKERFWGDFTVSYKGEVDLVTEVDRRCEELWWRLRGDSAFGFLAEENLYHEGSSASNG